MSSPSLCALRRHMFLMGSLNKMHRMNCCKLDPVAHIKVSTYSTQSSEQKNILELLHVGEGSSSLEQIYNDAKIFCKSKKLPLDINPSSVFANNELNLEEIMIYGFDYDYTLACYKSSMYTLIYTLALNLLIQEWKYPSEVSKLDLDPNFLIKGLHYDIEKGVLLKLDAFHQIQFGTVYRGLRKLEDDEVLSLYGGTHVIPDTYLGEKTEVNMQIMADAFSIPEMCLLTNITHYFETSSIHYLPRILFNDVKEAVKRIHPLMHKTVKSNISAYLKLQPDLKCMLERLKNENKKLFLITNSPVGFVNEGMKFMVGDDWQNLFDVIVCNAKKPEFFTKYQRPFRLFNAADKTFSWDKVNRLEPGRVYLDGTVFGLQQIMDWQGNQVLYFGDHPYNDLEHVTLNQCWRTGAVVAELEEEIDIMNQSAFKEQVNWLQVLSFIIEDSRALAAGTGQLGIIHAWEKERETLR